MKCFSSLLLLGIAACLAQVRADSEPLTCANMNCDGRCIDEPTGPKCVPKDPCAGVFCQPGYKCQEGRCRRSPGRITCANVRCAGRCIDKPEGPTCVPVNPCAAVDCLPGWRCVSNKRDKYRGRCVKVNN